MPRSCAPSRKPPRYFARSPPNIHRSYTRLLLTEKPEPVKLGPSDVLKLTFQVAEAGGGKGVQPHQTFLRFSDDVTGEEGVQPIRVTPGGRAKFELVRVSIALSTCTRVG